MVEKVYTRKGDDGTTADRYLAIMLRGLQP